MTGWRWDVRRAELADEQQAGWLRSRANARPCLRCRRPTTALSGICTRGDCLAVELELLAAARAAFAEGRSAYDLELDETTRL